MKHSDIRWRLMTGFVYVLLGSVIGAALFFAVVVI